MTSEELFSGLREAVRQRKQAEFYASLVLPSDFVKPLSGKKIERKYTK